MNKNLPFFARNNPRHDLRGTKTHPYQLRLRTKKNIPSSFPPSIFLFLSLSIAVDVSSGAAHLGYVQAIKAIRCTGDLF